MERQRDTSGEKKGRRRRDKATHMDDEETHTKKQQGTRGEARDAHEEKTEGNGETKQETHGEKEDAHGVTKRRAWRDKETAKRMPQPFSLNCAIFEARGYACWSYNVGGATFAFHLTALICTFLFRLSSLHTSQFEHINVPLYLGLLFN